MIDVQISREISTDLRIGKIEFIALNIDLLFGPNDAFWTHTRVIYSHPIGSLTLELSGAWELVNTKAILLRNITSIGAWTRPTVQVSKKIFPESNGLMLLLIHGPSRETVI